MTHGEYQPASHPPPSDPEEFGPLITIHHPPPPPPWFGTQTVTERVLYEEAAHITKRIRVVQPKAYPAGYCAPPGASIRCV